VGNFYINPLYYEAFTPINNQRKIERSSECTAGQRKGRILSQKGNLYFGLKYPLGFRISSHFGNSSEERLLWYPIAIVGMALEE
jgi:hypothetical protein